MKATGTILLGAVSLLISTITPSPAQSPQRPNASQARPSPSFQGITQDNVSQSRPLFMLGAEMGVHLWAPVQPPYDTHADRNFAADPLWEATAGTTQYSTW